MNTSHLRHRITAVATVVVCGLVVWASFAPDAPIGYEFPRIVSLSMLGIAVFLMLLAFKPGARVAGGEEEPVPWGAIWPLLLILFGFLLVSESLGYFVSSAIAFFLIASIYSPGRFSWARVTRVGAITLAFMGALYLIFIVVLNVQVPEGVLF